MKSGKIVERRDQVLITSFLPLLFNSWTFLNNTNTKASRLISKVLNSAIANAVNNNGAKESDLVISECYINPGKTRKKIRFGSRSNVDRHDKRTSHITIKVSDNVKEAK